MKTDHIQTICWTFQTTFQTFYPVPESKEHIFTGASCFLFRTNNYRGVFKTAAKSKMELYMAKVNS